MCGAEVAAMPTVELELAPAKLHHVRMPARSRRSPSKSPTGVAGLDHLTAGGFPRGRTTLIEGGPGAGKTVLALQFLVNGARQFGEPGIFVAFEESAARLKANAATFGWDLDALHRKRLFFVDAQPSADIVQSGAFDLGGLCAAVEARARRIGARRIVFDAVDVVLALLSDAAAARREVYRLHDWLLASGLTAIITAKTGMDDGKGWPLPTSQLQFMVDCAVSLTHQVSAGISHRGLRVVKYRGSGFSENVAPLVISRHGLEVAGAPPLVKTGRTDTALRERVSTGVARLDTMLEGGYYRRSSVLITGSPGTAKTTLCGAFVDAACRRGERALFVSFDSTPGEIVRNLESVKIRLDRHRKSGLLRLVSARSGTASAEAHLGHIVATAREHRARCLVVDPLSALGTHGEMAPSPSPVIYLTDWAKAEGLTLVCSSLVEGARPDAEKTALQISTIADTWIHLSYLVRGGERNRALTIVKSRGTDHSNQVRELILGAAGVTLADVFSAGGEVLMGALRWEKEQAQVEQQREQAIESQRRLADLDRIDAQLAARHDRLQAIRRANRIERKALERAGDAQLSRVRDSEAAIQRLRKADAPRKPRQPVRS
jgi:circadian clock protein KaiC